MIVITGAAGFIGSCLAAALNEQSRDDLLLVDDFSPEAKRQNWQAKRYAQTMDRQLFLDWLAHNGQGVEVLYHLGARTDTSESDTAIFDRLNLHYSQSLWKHCTNWEIPFIYASSAATYGAGELGYQDDHRLIPKLRPLNPYGDSKQQFDLWALAQTGAPPYWAGLKFYNVYGPNEHHKGRMASVVYHAFHQIRDTGKVKLFRSHRSDYEDGMQLRDFIYVKDIIAILQYMAAERPAKGIYNAGTGNARSFKALAEAVFRATGRGPQIEYIDMPEDIRDAYQYFTQAEMNKLTESGFNMSMHSLEAGIEAYVQQYLMKNRIY